MQKPIAKIFKNNGSDLSSEEFQSTLITIIIGIVHGRAGGQSLWLLNFPELIMEF